MNAVELREVGRAEPGTRPDEVVLALSPGFAGFFTKTIVDVPHAEVVRQILAGIEEQGVHARVIQVRARARKSSTDSMSLTPRPPGARAGRSGAGGTAPACPSSTTRR